MKPFHEKPGELKTVIFSEVQAMHTLSTDYGPLCLVIPAASINCAQQ